MADSYKPGCYNSPGRDLFWKTFGVISVNGGRQYTGFLLITLGMMFEWATIPLLIMWPILVLLYNKLAKKEEQYMEQEFGQEYMEYKSKTGMFLPF